METEVVASAKKGEVREPVVGSVPVEVVDVEPVRDRAVGVGPDTTMEPLAFALKIEPAPVVPAPAVLLNRFGDHHRFVHTKIVSRCVCNDPASAQEAPTATG